MGIEIGEMRLIKGMKAYFAAAMVDAFAGTIMLVSIPADPKNGWALGLSKARWGMMASLIGVGLVCLWVNIQLWRNPAWTQKMQRGSSRLMQNGKLAGGVFTLALSGVAAAGLLLIEWISPGEGDYRDLLIRMGPLLLVGGAVCAQTIVLMLASMPKGRQRTWLVWTALAGASIPGQYLLLPWKHHNLMAVSLPVLLLGIAVWVQAMYLVGRREKMGGRSRRIVFGMLLVLGGVIYYNSANIHGTKSNNNMAVLRGDQNGYLSLARKARETGFDHTGNRNQMPLYSFLQASIIDMGQDALDQFEQGKQANLILSMVLLFSLFVILNKYISTEQSVMVTLVIAFGLIVYKSAYYQAEILFYFLSAASFWLMAKMLISPSFRLGIWTGLVLGLTFLTKASMLAGLAAFLVCFLLKLALDKGTPKKAWLGNVVVLGFVFLSVCYPYISESKEVYGRYFFNLGGSVAIWYDTWGDYIHVMAEYRNEEGLIIIPEDELGGAGEYLKSHSWRQIYARLATGFNHQMWNLSHPYSYYNYPALLGLYLLGAVIMTTPQSVALIKEHIFLVGFGVSYFLGYLLLFSWYSPLAGGVGQDARFTYGLYIPFVLSAIAALREVLKRADRIKIRKLEVKPAEITRIGSLALLAMLFVDIYFAAPTQLISLDTWFGK